MPVAFQPKKISFHFLNPMPIADPAALPFEWLADLHDAVKRGKDELIDDLLEQLGLEHAA